MYHTVSAIRKFSLPVIIGRWDFRSITKKIFFSLGVVFAIVLLLFALIFGYVFIEGKRLDGESNNFVQELVPTISKTWNEKLLYEKSDREFRRVTSLEDLHQFFAMAEKKLGPFMYYEGSEGNANIFLTPSGRNITAQYVSRVHYQNAPADIIVNLIYQDGKWLIQGYRINSPVFSALGEEEHKTEQDVDTLKSLPSAVIIEEAS